MNNIRNTCQPAAPALGIYIHIPFCRKKCAYCDFLSFPADDETIGAYLEALQTQINAFGMAAHYRPVSIFIGGGTPSVLSGAQLGRLLHTVYRRFAITDPSALEITVECNPGTLDAMKLKAMREAGVNRLSIGVQSLDNALLQTLGRIHDKETFLESWSLAREAGFNNLNLDLMSALPGQTPALWEATLRGAAALSPEHISAYSLIIEEGTPFAALYGEKGPLRDCLPDEDTDREMYHMTETVLAEYGYHRYEISNYARSGYHCQHNDGYWLRRQYAGFGLGASSQLEDTRSRNTDSLAAYLTQYRPGRHRECHTLQEYLTEQTDVTRLSLTDCIEETMYLGLRRTAGIDLAAFENTFGQSVYDIYGKLPEKLQSEGLLETDGHYMKLTPYGTDISNYVMAQFLL